MKSWGERPIEIANLFNPAFCATVLACASRGFSSERVTGLPWLMAFLVVPLILHKTTRAVAPKIKTTKLHVWIEKNPAIRIGFVERARSMVPHVQEALIFGVTARLLLLDHDNGTIFAGAAIPKGEVTTDSDEVRECLRRARTLGAVLANAGEEHTVWAMLGLQA